MKLKKIEEVLALVGHGGWLQWLDKNCKMSVATAQAYMRVSAGGLPNTERAQYLEEPKSIRQAIAFLAGPGKKAGPNKEKVSSGPEDGENDILRVTSLAKRLQDTLGRLPREKQNEALGALAGIREWMNEAAVDVKATRVG